MFYSSLDLHYLCLESEDRMRLGNFEQAQLRSTFTIFAWKARIGFLYYLR